LRDLRNLLTGEVLDNGCQLIKQKLPTSLIRKLDGYQNSAGAVLGASAFNTTNQSMNSSTISGTPNSSSTSHGSSGSYVGGNVSYHKLRSILKALLLLGANLSQSREYRDLFEDIITKVRIRLFEAFCNCLPNFHRLLNRSKRAAFRRVR
jgi:hypothetical protein